MLADPTEELHASPVALAALGYGVLGGLPLGVRAPFEAAAVLGVAACATLSLVATARGRQLPARTG